MLSEAETEKNKRKSPLQKFTETIEIQDPVAPTASPPIL